MKMQDAVKKWQEGGLLLSAEFRSFKVETPTLRDKESGRSIPRVVKRYCLEVGGESVIVTEWQPEGTNAASLTCNFPRGAKGVLHVENLVREKGLLNARGSFEPFDA